MSIQQFLVEKVAKTDKLAITLAVEVFPKPLSSSHIQKNPRTYLPHLPTIVIKIGEEWQKVVK